MLVQANSMLSGRDVGTIAFRRGVAVYPAQPGTCLFGTGVARL